MEGGGGEVICVVSVLALANIIFLIFALDVLVATIILATARQAFRAKSSSATQLQHYIDP